MILRHVAVPHFILALVVLLTPLATAAPTYTTDFESFALGDVNGQDGWFIPGANNALANIDQEIVDIGAGAFSGTKVWKLSNRSPSGNPNESFSMPQTPTVDAAGESTTGATFDSIRFSFAFKAVSAAADGTKIDIDLAPSSGAGQPSDDRKTLFRLNNVEAGGIRIIFFDTDGNSFISHDLGLVSRTDWHTVEMDGTFPDGPGLFDRNDTVTIKIDGVDVGTFSTWESWREGNFGPGAILDVNHVMFHLRDPEAPFDTLDGSSSGFFADPLGYYFDDVSLESFDTPPPAVPTTGIAGLAALVAGLGLFLGMRVRRSN